MTSNEKRKKVFKGLMPLYNPPKFFHPESAEQYFWGAAQCAPSQTFKDL